MSGNAHGQAARIRGRLSHMALVVPEASEPVGSPDFFKGTVVAGPAAELLARAPARA